MFLNLPRRLRTNLVNLKLEIWTKKNSKQLADVENKLSRKAKRLHKQREQTARELEEKIKKN